MRFAPSNLNCGIARCEPATGWYDVGHDLYWNLMYSPQAQSRKNALHSYAVGDFDWLEWVFLIAISLWALGVFSAWLPVQLLFGDPDTYLLPLETAESLNVLTGWLPLAKSVSEGNLLPLLSATGSAESGLAFYPYITLWLNGILVALFGVTGSALVGEVLFPAAGLVTFVLILRQFIPRRWAISLAALGFLATISFPLREFLTALFGGAGWQDLGIVSHLDIAHFPIPSFSVLCFLLVLKFSLSRRRLTFRRMTFLTVLWALLSQVHPVNAVVGLIFWFAYFPLDLARQNRTRKLTWTIHQTTRQMLLAILVCSPAIYTFIGSESVDLIDLNYSNNDRDFPVTMYYIGIYFLLPIFMTTCLFVVLRIDLYEMFTRFRPIYTMMATELLIIVSDVTAGVGIPAENLYSRLGVYVLHPLYFIPVVYLFCRASGGQLSQTYSKGTESIHLAAKARWLVDWLANEASKVYLPALLVVLTFYAMSTARQDFRFFQGHRASWAGEISEQLAAIQERADASDIVATANPLANIYIPIMSEFGAIWVEGFSNKLAEDEVVSRFALYGHLSGWNIDQFQHFMAPGRPHLAPSVRSVSTDVPNSLGYWYAYQHRRPVDIAATNAHTEKMRVIYNNADPVVLIQRFGLKFWLGSLPIIKGLPVKAVYITNAGPLHEFDIVKEGKTR
jgi:hypothetical protein